MSAASTSARLRKKARDPDETFECCLATASARVIPNYQRRRQAGCAERAACAPGVHSKSYPCTSVAAPATERRGHTMPAVRPAAVAGMFYPGTPSRLAAEVRAYLADVPSSAGAAPKAIVVPHAGYVYSGPVAASAYARLVPLAGIGDARRPAGTDAPRADPRPGGVSGARVRHAARRGTRRHRGGRMRARAAAGRRQRIRACARTRARGAAAVPADGARALRGGPVCRRRRVGRGGRRRARCAVGRRRDADRRQFRSVALPHLRRRRADRPRHRRCRPRAVARARPRAGVRRHAGQRPAAVRAPARARRRSSSTCATPATPRATVRAWSATRPLRSPNDARRH